MTTTPATQALFPVTPEARKAACEYLSDIAGLRGGDAVTDIHDDHPTLIAFARFERDITGRQAHSLPGDVGTAEALTFIDKFFEPWGSWKTVWWKGEVSDDAAFSADNALKHVANILRRAALAPSALSGDAGEGE